MTDDEQKKLSLKEFDRAAAKFDDDDPSVYNLCRKNYPDVQTEVVKEPFSDLLDVGCGTGAMLELFKRDAPGKNYTGVDLSEKMIKTAKIKRLGGIRFVVGDCEALPFADSSFDVVTCSMCFHHYPNPGKFFVSSHRVLRPGRTSVHGLAAVQELIRAVARSSLRDFHALVLTSSPFWFRSLMPLSAPRSITNLANTIAASRLAVGMLTVVQTFTR